MKSVIILVLAYFSSLLCLAQEIVYSKPERDDLIFKNWDTKSNDIIGRVDSSILIYKKIRNKHLLSIYNDHMVLRQNVSLSLLPSNVTSVEFVNDNEQIHVIYQFQKRNVFYCMAFTLDETGKILRKPVELDTIHIRFIADLQLYHIATSEDKSKIMVYQLYKGDVFTGSGLYEFTTILFNDSLHLIHRSKIESIFENETDIFSEFLVDNEGNFVFTKATKIYPTNRYEELMLVIKAPLQDYFTIRPLDLSGNLLDRVDLRVDNINMQYLINAFYFRNKNGHKYGIYTALWDKNKGLIITTSFFSFEDPTADETALRKTENNSLDNFYLREVILTKNGGFLATMEDMDNPNPYVLPWYLGETPIYYSSSYFFSSLTLSGGGVRKNILILFFDKNLHLQWSKEIEKSQSSGLLSSFTFMNTGKRIYFLYNELERQHQIINEQSLEGDGGLSVKKPLRKIGFDYELLSPYAKQISSQEIVFPCKYRNYICFAKINY